MFVSHPDFGGSLNLNLLIVFSVVAEKRSFKLAASVLGRSHSAVSAQVKSLELQLGVALFHRTTRSVSLTVHGETLLTNVRRGLQDMRLGVRAIREGADLRSGQISIGCSPLVAAFHMPRILATFERAYPQVRLVMREMPAVDLAAALLNMELDLAIGPISGDQRFHIQPVLQDRICAFVPHSLISRPAKAMRWDAIAQHPLLLLGKSHVVRRATDEKLSRKGIKLNIKYEFTHATTIMKMVDEGLGIGILPDLIAAQSNSDRASLVKLTAPSIHRTITVARIASQPPSPAARGMIDTLVTYFSQIPTAR